MDSKIIQNADISVIKVKLLSNEKLRWIRSRLTNGRDGEIGLAGATAAARLVSALTNEL